MLVTIITIKDKKYQVFEYSRGGTKSPHMWILVDIYTGKQYTPYARRYYDISISLTNLFKIVYSRHIENLIPSGISLMSKIPKCGEYTYTMPVPLGKEHGVTFGEKEEETV